MSGDVGDEADDHRHREHRERDDRVEREGADLGPLLAPPPDAARAAAIVPPEPAGDERPSGTAAGAAEHERPCEHPPERGSSGRRHEVQTTPARGSGSRPRSAMMCAVRRSLAGLLFGAAFVCACLAVAGFLVDRTVFSPGDTRVRGAGGARRHHAARRDGRHRDGGDGATAREEPRRRRCGGASGPVDQGRSAARGRPARVRARPAHRRHRHPGHPHDRSTSSTSCATSVPPLCRRWCSTSPS